MACCWGLVYWVCCSGYVEVGAAGLLLVSLLGLSNCFCCAMLVCFGMVLLVQLSCCWALLLLLCCCFPCLFCVAVLLSSWAAGLLQLLLACCSCLGVVCCRFFPAIVQHLGLFGVAAGACFVLPLLLFDRCCCGWLFVFFVVGAPFVAFANFDVAAAVFIVGGLLGICS